MAKIINLNNLSRFKEDFQSFLEEDGFTKFYLITHAALKVLRDSGSLFPGSQYRIVDYACTTIQADTQSAGHAFDIIVTADNESTLNENARAIQHNGDTYFRNSNLKAWELKYSLDNDTARFAWADTTNGKGVIYWMKDDGGNECCYDFKNIIFKGNGMAGTLATKYYYTFSVVTGSGSATITDHSLNTYYCYENKINGYWSSNRQQLNSNIFRNTSSTVGCHDNTFGSNCYNNTFDTTCYNNTFGSNCYNNTLKITCCDNTFGSNCYNNTFDNSSNRNILGNFFYNNTFGANCSYNTFGNYCSNNTLGGTCAYNTFGNNSYGNTLGSECNNNTFGEYCYSNLFGKYTSYISAGCCVINNKFGGTAATVGYIEKLTLDSGVAYATITGGTSSSNKVKNAHLLPGKYNGTVTFEANKEYTQTAGVNSSGAIKVWKPADLV